MNEMNLGAAVAKIMNERDAAIRGVEALREELQKLTLRCLDEERLGKRFAAERNAACVEVAAMKAENAAYALAMDDLQDELKRVIAERALYLAAMHHGQTQLGKVAGDCASVESELERVTKERDALAGAHASNTGLQSRLMAELSTLRGQAAWQDARMEQYARTSAAHLNSWAENNAKLREQLAAAEREIAETELKPCCNAYERYPALETAARAGLERLRQAATPGMYPFGWCDVEIEALERALEELGR